MKNICTISLIFFICSLLYASVESKSLDPYKVLGVEKDANSRQIQKAFHKLSLQYHPDKNKNKGAQEKFAEINNAYEILSDEEKRKNYDMYGDARGNPGFTGGDAGHHGGHTYFRSGGGPGHGGGFTFMPDEWQTMGGQSGGSKSYSFSFGGSGGDSSFGFDVGDVFSNFFGGGMSGGGMGGGGNPFGGFGNSGGGSRSSSPKNMVSINSQLYKKEVTKKGVTWIMLSYTPLMKGIQHFESIIEEVGNSLKGALEVGSVNCQVESSFCKDVNIRLKNKPRVYIYSYKSTETGSLIEYTGDLTVKDLKSFVQEHLPKFSKRVNTLTEFETKFESLPKVILLSTKKDTPVIWRALSGMYRKRFIFYDTQVKDVSDSLVKKLGVDTLPAVVGSLSNGEMQVLKSGIHVKDMKSTIKEISLLLDGFEKKNKKIASNMDKSSDSDNEGVPLLTATNFDSICGEKTPVCVIGVFKSDKGREKLHKILSSVSRKSLLRRENPVAGPRDSVSYAILDGVNQSSFLYAFDKSGFKSSDMFLVAYKSRKLKFSAYTGDVTFEEVERFVGSVLNGDVQFSKTRQKPMLK